MDEFIKYRKAYLKDIIEFLKYLSTLSTGSLLLMVAFLDKLKLLDSYQPYLKYSFVAFIVSIAGSVLGYAMIVFVELKQGSERRETKVINAFLGLVGVSINFLGFISGIVLMAMFAMANIG
ncbi:hypothetical protein [Vibrio cionasavignyae]|uniref:hypothetical protein n=1 Tax=Vibrio cionasavignyae TaxID=2910252 RepID=UPI003D0CECDA